MTKFVQSYLQLYTMLDVKENSVSIHIAVTIFLFHTSIQGFGLTNTLDRPHPGVRRETRNSCSVDLRGFGPTDTCVWILV